MHFLVVFKILLRRVIFCIVLKKFGLFFLGELDNETIEMMNMPKLYSATDNTERSTRKKRYIEGKLYCFLNYLIEEQILFSNICGNIYINIYN